MEILFYVLQILLAWAFINHLALFVKKGSVFAYFDFVFSSEVQKKEKIIFFLPLLLFIAVFIGMAIYSVAFTQK